jgi:hypothetical protein
MKQRGCIALALGCFAVACEAVGTIGRATGIDDDVDGGMSSSGDEVELDDAASDSSSGDDGLATTGDRDPASGGDDTGTSDGTSTGDGPGTFMSETGVDSGTTPDQPCCTPGDEPGCEDMATQTCVCELDPYCCEKAWDEACVNTALLSDCSSCPMAMKPEIADCCAANMVGGCTDADVQDCVCAVDPYCCLQAWDQMCVDKIDELGCGSCP